LLDWFVLKDYTNEIVLLKIKRYAYARIAYKPVFINERMDKIMRYLMDSIADKESQEE